MQMVFIGERKTSPRIKTASFGKQSLGQQNDIYYEITPDYLAKGFLIDLGRC